MHLPPPIPRIGPRTGGTRRACLLAALGLGMVASLNATPPSGGTYSLPRQVIAGGGAAASGGSYSLVGTVGQSVTGPTGASTTLLQQGFHGPQAGPDELFNNGFE
jgi:hypothetical protein